MQNNVTEYKASHQILWKSSRFKTFWNHTKKLQLHAWRN